MLISPQPSAACFALFSPHRSLRMRHRRNYFSLTNHVNAGDQDPEDHWEGANDYGAPSESIVETSGVEGATVHGRNACGTERGADIGQPSSPPGQRPSSPTGVARHAEEEPGRDESNGTVEAEKCAFDHSSD